MQKNFKRRLYPGIGDWVEDLRSVLSQRRRMRRVMRGEAISRAFRERLMLAVTAVNGCRYCSFFHARQALVAGIPPEEVDALSAGTMAGCPPDELPAVLYAQHWAETNARPDPAARQRIVDLYGEETTGDIELVLRTIRMGNMAGNTADYVLYRLSFGRLGNGRLPAPGQPKRAEARAP